MAHNLKAVILGTNQTGDDARAVLRQAGTEALQRMAGYVPGKANIMPIMFGDNPLDDIHTYYADMVVGGKYLMTVKRKKQQWLRDLGFRFRKNWGIHTFQMSFVLLEKKL